MNSIAAFLAVSAIFAVVTASGYGGGASSGGSYGGAAVTIPAPPCPKNYLFSCQPNLSPAPCSPAAASGGSGGYGSSGAYSDNIPTIVNAPYPGGYQGYPNFQHQFPNFYGQGGSSNN